MLKNRSYIPFLLGVSAALGLWLGSGMQDPFESASSSTKMNKIEQILLYVENDYVDTVSRDKLEDEIITYLLQRLDPHSRYISEDELSLVNEPLEGNFEGIGVQFNLRKDSIYVVSVIKGGPSENAGVKPGDIIVKVDDQTVAGTGLTSERVMALLKGPSTSQVDVGVRRKGEKELVDLKITRGQIPISSFDAAYLLNDSTIYVRLARFAKTTYEEFEQEVKPLKTDATTRMILDLRGNGGGFLHAAVQVADEFLEKDLLITYTEGKSRPRRDYRSSSEGSFKSIELAVLIDGMSASASEIVAGAFQDLNRGVIIGQKSFGKGLVQEQNEWDDGSATRLTVARYYTPNGRSIQNPYNEIGHSITEADTGAGGIIPDVVVGMDTSGVTWMFAELVHSGKMTRYAYAYRDDHIDRFSALSAVEFIDQVSEEEFATALRAYLEQEQGKINERDWNRSRVRMSLRMKAIVARSLYGEEAYFRVLNATDPFVQEALRQLDKSLI